MRRLLTPILFAALLFAAASAVRASADTVAISDITTLQAAIDGAGGPRTIEIAAGTHVLGLTNILVSKPDITIQGAGTLGTKIQVSSTGYRFSVTSPGCTIRNLEIEKTDAAGEQNIIWINAINATVQDNKIHGQFVIGDGDISRAIVVSAGSTGLVISGNTIYALRQPAYFSGLSSLSPASTITSNFVYGTKGWVVEGGNQVFSGNTWGTGANANVYDVAILAGVTPGIYPDIVAMSNANHAAVIEDQRPVQDILSIVAVSAAAAPGGAGSPTAPYQTIGPALPRVAPGGTIHVAAGTYVETIAITKAMTLAGAGSATTSIDASSLPTGGNVVGISGITAGNVTLSGFTLVTAPATTVGSNALSITGVATGSTITVQNNLLRCVQSALGTAMENYGLIAGYGSDGHLVFDHNTVYGGGDNPVLIERWTGLLDFTYNTVYRGPDDTASKDALFVMNYGVSNISAKQRFDSNTIDMGGGATFDNAHRGTGISVVAQYVGGAGPGGYTDVEITRNRFVNLKPFRRGIGLWDNSSGPGDVIALIQCNTVSSAPGYTGDHGIRLLGGITGTTITGNNLSGLGTGFQARPWNEDPSGFTLANNNLTGNAIGVENLSAIGLTANGNWWGSAAGPGIGGNNGYTGLVTATTWLGVPEPNCTPTSNVAPGPAPSCVTAVNSCIRVPVDFNRMDTAPVRGYSVSFTLGGGLSLCDSAVVAGTYLSAVGPTHFEYVSNGGGSYTVDCAILGGAAGATGSGTLFTLKLSGVGTGTGTVTIDNVTARDLSNGPVAGVPGAPLSITIDHSAPGAMTTLAASQRKTLNDGDGTTKIDLAWPAYLVESGASVEIYRAGFGHYPEYNDEGGVEPTPVGYPPAGWTPVTLVAGGSGYTDEPSTRDFWYYVAFVRDACGNVSAISNKTGGTLNYHLGDVAPPSGNNVVNGLDISLLGANYGLTLGSPNYLDVGPTTDYSVNGRPTTDNKINFEDLMMFALNYGVVSVPQDRPALVAAGANKLSVTGAAGVVPGETFTLPVQMSGAGDVQGASVVFAYDAAVVEFVSAEAGDLLRSQGRQALVLSPSAGIVDFALLGEGAGVQGEGVLVNATFRRIAAGEPGLALKSVTLRNGANQAVGITGTKPALPSLSLLGMAYPNPFRGRTSLQLALARDGHVRVAVYDLVGRRIRTLVDGTLVAGTQTIAWDGRDDGGRSVAAGLYLVRFDTPGAKQSRRLVLMP